MRFSIQLGYTPRCPQPGVPFTEQSFIRKHREFVFDTSEIGVALVDLWNFGWPDGPVGATLGPDYSYEWGESHARRKRYIVENLIAPTVQALREAGIQIFHCNLWEVLSKYPQWQASTTAEERNLFQQTLTATQGNSTQHGATGEGNHLGRDFPPKTWVREWKAQHVDDVDGTEWLKRSADELCNFDIPEPVRPKTNDLLVATRDQFHRLLCDREIRVLFYMGFETNHCVQFKPYGIANMTDLGYLCSIVRDCTTTYESAKTLDGLWRTQVSIEEIEMRYGYSVDSTELVKAVTRAYD